MSAYPLFFDLFVLKNKFVALLVKQIKIVMMMLMMMVVVVVVVVVVIMMMMAMMMMISVLIFVVQRKAAGNGGNKVGRARCNETRPNAFHHFMTAAICGCAISNIC